MSDRKKGRGASQAAVASETRGRSKSPAKAGSSDRAARAARRSRTPGARDASEAVEEGKTINKKSKGKQVTKKARTEEPAPGGDEHDSDDSGAPEEISMGQAKVTVETKLNLEEAARLRLEEKKKMEREAQAARDRLRQLEAAQKRERERPNEMLPAKLLSVLGSDGPEPDTAPAKPVDIEKRKREKRMQRKLSQLWDSAGIKVSWCMDCDVVCCLTILVPGRNNQIKGYGGGGTSCWNGSLFEGNFLFSPPHSSGQPQKA